MRKFYLFLLALVPILIFLLFLYLLGEFWRLEYLNKFITF